MNAKRLLGALLVAVPATWLTTAIGDNANIPQLVRALISPGMTIALRLDIRGEGFFDTVAKVSVTALLLNEVYYTLIIYGLLTCAVTLLRLPHLPAE